MGAIRTANDVVAFLLELAALAALAWWGFTVDAPVIVRILLGVAAPAAMIGVWATLLAPRAARRLGMPWLVLAKAVVLGLGAAALWAAAGPVAGLVLAVLVAVNLTLAAAWDRV